MRDRRRRAGGVQAEKQQRYVQSIAQGVNSEACRLVGIDRKTGNRWRYGRRVRNSAGALVIYPPVKITESRPRSPRYLSEQERIRIADMLAAGSTVRGIAVELGRAPSTIGREIARNSDPDGRYRPHHAEQASRLRAAKPRTRRIAGDGVLADTVQRLLVKRWSPSRSRVRTQGRWRGRRAAVALVVQGVDLPGDLRRCGGDHPAGASSSPQATSPRAAAARQADRDADDRRAASRGGGPCPTWALGGRSDHGRWEPLGDRNARERTTRFLILLRFPDGIATTDEVRDAITQALESLPARLRRTLTWDQGDKEPARHQQITSAIGTGVFFCDAHSPWQRDRTRTRTGCCATISPKGTDLSVHTAVDVGRIAAEVNDRPRKTLGSGAPSTAVLRRGVGRLRGPKGAKRARTPRGSTPARPSGLASVEPRARQLPAGGQELLAINPSREEGAPSPAHHAGRSAVPCRPDWTTTTASSVATLASFPTITVGPVQTIVPTGRLDRS